MATQIDTDQIVLDFKNGNPAVDLATVPLGVELLRIAALEFRNSVLHEKFLVEMAQVVQRVDFALRSTRAGYLFRLELYTDEFGTPVVPGGQLVVPLDVGREPLDALAEWHRKDILSHKAPKGLTNHSTYIWVRRSGETLLASSLLLADRGTFERNALAEARRRKLAMDPHGWDALGYASVKRAGIWSEIASERLADVQTASRRDQIRRLNNEMAAAEEQFNAAYRRYQSIAADMVRNSEHLKVLSQIETVLAVFKLATDTGLIGSSTGELAKSSAQPKSTLADDKARSTSLFDQTAEQLRHTAPDVNAAGQKLRQLEIEVRAIYGDEGIPLPHVEPLGDLSVLP